MMKSLYEEFGGTYTLGNDGMLYPDLVIGDKEQRPIGKWGRMHMKYLEVEHPGLYERLILSGTLYRHRPRQRVRCAVEAPPRVQAPAAEPAVVRAHAAGHPRGHPP